ncbi:hypothetical protein EON80_07705 [bacterium]|nr:MAG: hypothetical protein EON80_07705 [bacterium]
MFLLSGLGLGGCSSTSSPPSTPQQSTPSPAQPVSTQPKGTPSAAKSLVDAITGNAGDAREKARLLFKESNDLLAARDINGAMDKRIQMLQLRGTSTSMLGALTGYAIQSMALDHLSRIASQLDAESSQKYATELKALDAKSPTYVQLLQAEKAQEVKSFESYTRKPGDWKKLIAGLGFKTDQQAVLNKLTPAQVKANIAKFYDGKIASANQPYSAQVSEPATDPYTAYVTKHISMARFVWTKNKTLRLFAIVALDRKTDHSLNRERVGPLPADPFGDGPLKEKGGMVYSVGPDTVDDGGSFVNDVERFNPKTKGDMLMPLFSPMRHLAQPID